MIIIKTISYNDKDNKDNKINRDNDLLPQTFLEPIKDYISNYKLPNHEKYATNLLHLITTVDIKSNAYKKFSFCKMSSTLEFTTNHRKSL